MSKVQKNNPEIVAQAVKKFKEKAKAQGLKNLVILNVSPELKKLWDTFKNDNEVQNGAEALTLLLIKSGYQFANFKVCDTIIVLPDYPS